MHFWGHTYVQSIVRHLSDKSVAAGSLTPLMYTVLASESCKFHTCRSPEEKTLTQFRKVHRTAEPRKAHPKK